LLLFKFAGIAKADSESPSVVNRLALRPWSLAARASLPLLLPLLCYFEESLRHVKLALTVDVKAAAQEAINAALEVLRAAVNDAAKFAIF
jgi:hypothetical protein